MKALNQVMTPNKSFFYYLYQVQPDNIFKPYFTYQQLDAYLDMIAGKRAVIDTVENITDIDTDMPFYANVFYNKFLDKYLELLKVSDIIRNDGGWNPTENYSLSSTVTTEYGKETKNSGTDTTENTPRVKTKTKDSSGGDDTVTDETVLDSTSTSERIPFGATEPQETDKNKNNHKDQNKKEYNSYTEHEVLDITGTDKTELQHGLTMTDSGEDKITRMEHGSLGVSSAIDQVLKNKNGFKEFNILELLIQDTADFLTIPYYITTI